MTRKALFSWIPFRLAAIVAPLIAAWPQRAQAANQTWTGTTSAVWHTVTNWSGGAFPGANGAGANLDIATFNGTVATAIVGLNQTTAGGTFSLGALDMNRTVATALTIGNNTATAGVLRLNGATLTSANTLIRVAGSADLTISGPGVSGGTAAMGLQLGITNGIFDVGASRTLAISSIISQVTAGSGFTKDGAGTLTLSGANTYTGVTTINAGTVIAQANAAFGTTAGGTVINGTGVLNLGGSLAADALNMGTEAISVIGVGSGAGAIIATGTAQQQNAIQGAVTLTGATTFGGTRRWDIRNGTLNGGGFDLTKIGANSIFLSGTSQIGTALNSLTVREGEYTFETGALASAAKIANGITLQPTAAVLGGFRSWGNNVDHSASILMDSSFAGSSTRLEVQNGTTTHSGTITATGSDNRLDVDFNQVMNITGLLAGGGSLRKDDTGTLLINNAGNTHSGTFTINTGIVGGSGTLSSPTVNWNTGTTLSPGNGSLTAGALSITNTMVSSGTNTAIFNLGTSSDLINAGTLTQNGTSNISVVHNPGIAAGTYTLFDYATLDGTNGFAGFALGGNHVDGVLQNNVGAGTVELVLNSANPLTWTGASNGILLSGSLNNPILPNFSWPAAPGGAVEFVNTDNLLFDDTATGTTSIALSGTVIPGSLRFNNSTLNYTIDGVFTGATGLVKDGSGTTTLLSDQTFQGPVSINAGTLQLGSDSRQARIQGSNSNNLGGVSPDVNVAAGATFAISAGGNAELSVNNNISGSGSIVLNASQQDNYYNFIADRGNTAFRGDNTGFTGTISINDGNRLRANSVNALGNASGIIIADGGALLLDSANPITYAGAISVAGQGWQETGGSGGALRINAGTTLSGPITLTGDSRFTAWNGSSGTLSGAISGAGHDLEFGFRQIAANSSGTLNVTNTGSSYSGDTTITRMTINAGTLADTGVNSSLGSGGALNMEASTLNLAGATAGADAMTSNRTIRLNQLGVGGSVIGLTDPLDSLTLTGPILNGNASFPASTLNFQQTTTAGMGGTIIINNTGTTLVTGSTIHRQNLTLAGNTNFVVGYPVTGTAASPFGAPGGFNVGNNLSAADSGSVTLTIQDNATLTTYGDFDIGNQNSGAPITTTVNQTGGTVSALKGGGSYTNTDAGNRALRLGHWANNNAVYNLSGGTLNVTNGYMNVAWDGNGTLNQAAGTTANIRGLRLGNSNTATGIYNLNGGTLNIGDLGLVRGGTNTTHVLNLNGGTYRATADHTIGSGININVGAGGGTVDTNGYNVLSSSAILLGGGAGGLTKTGDGLLELPSGNSTYTGITLVNGGFLGGTGAAPAITASNVVVNSGGAVSGNLSFSAGGPPSLTVNNGGAISPGAFGGAGTATITAAIAQLNAGANVNITPGVGAAGDVFDVTGPSGLATPGVGTANVNVLPVGTLAAGTYTLVNYDTAIGGGGYAGLAVNLPHLIGATVADNIVTTAVELTVGAGSQETLTWTGLTNGAWNTAGANVNFNASTSGAVNYLQGDVAVFDDSTAPANTAITIAAAGVTPASVTISDTAGVFVFTGGGIGGGTSVVKNGIGTSVLATNNTYTGGTTINAGTLQFGNGGTAGSAGFGPIANGGTLSYNRSDASAVYNTISGTGIVRSDGPGTTTLVAANSYAGGTVISKGTLVGRTATSFGTGTITLNDASTGSADTGLYFNPIFNDTAITVANNIVVGGQGTGTVRLGSNERSNRLQGTIFSGTVSLGRDVTMYGEFDRTTFTNVISGTADTITIAPSAGLSAGQPGRVTWEGANTFTPASAAVTTINILDGAILQVNNAALTDQIPDTATVNVQAGGVFQVGTALDNETIGTLMGAGTVRNVTNTALNITFGTAADATFSGVLNGGNTLSFIKQGAGTQTISGVLDNPSANVTVNAGTVLLAKVSTPTVHALGGNPTINTGGTLQLGGTYIDTRPASDGRAGNNTIPRNAPANYGDQIYNDIDVTVNAGGFLDLGGKSEAFDALLGTGTVTNSVAGTESTLFLSANGASGTWSGTIQDGAGVVNVAKGGTGGTITLATANTYTGTTDIRGGGGVTINNTASLGAASGATTFTANRDGAALLTIAIATASTPAAPNIISEPLNFISELSGDQRTNVVNNTESTRLDGAITVTGDGLMQINAGQAAGDQFQINGNITGTSSGILFLRGGTTTTGEMQLNGVITAPNLIVSKTEPSLLILNSTGHDYFETSLVHGTVRADVVDALDTGAVLRMGQASNANTFDINGNNQTVAAIRVNTGVTDAQARTITNSSGTAAAFTVNTPATSGGDYNYAGNLTGNLSFVKSGPGIQALSTPTSGSNTYTGNTVINEGVLRLGNANLIPDGGAAGNLIAGTGLTPATFDVNGNAETVNGLHGNSMGIVTSNGTGSPVLTANGTATPLASATFAGVIQNNTDGGAGTLSFTKIGAGTQILSGINTFTGPTTINGGTLLVNGTDAFSAVTVNTGGTLGGSGTVNTVAVNSGGTLSPGNSPGILTTGSVTTSSGSFVSFELEGLTAGNGSGFHDQVNTAGGVTLNSSTLVLSLSYAGVNAGDEFFIWLNDSNDAVSGTFGNAPTEGSFIAAGGGGFTVSYLANGDLGSIGNDISVTWVPEPGSTSLTLAAGLLALGRRRRRAA